MVPPAVFCFFRVCVFRGYVGAGGTWVREMIRALKTNLVPPHPRTLEIKKSHARKKLTPREISFGQSSLCRLFVERGQVVACLLHHAHHMVETDAMLAVGEGCIEVGVEGTTGGKGITLDAGNLNQTAHGVARHAQMVFQSHLRRIFYLLRSSAEELAGGC